MGDISLNAISVLKALKELEDNNLICIDVSLETYLDESCINSEPLITKRGIDFLDRYSGKMNKNSEERYFEK